MGTFDYTYEERFGRDVVEDLYQKFYIETPVEDATITVSDEATEIVTVTIQVVDPAGDPIGRQMLIEFFVCSDAACHTISAIANTTVAAGTDTTILKAVTANAHLLVITDDDGKAILTVTDSVDATKTGYCAVLLPNGTYVVAEDGIIFTDDTP